MFHSELYRSKFDHTNKWYVHNPISVTENETHEIVRDFENQTHHLVLDRRLEQLFINKKKELVINRILPF